MSYWKIKALLQGIISILPASHIWNQLLQRYVTKSLVLNWERFRVKIEICKRHLENYLRVHPHVREFTVLELGTGRFPVIPLGLFLCGAGKFVTVDQVSLLRQDVVRRTLNMVLEHASQGNLPRTVPERLDCLRSVAESSDSLSAEQILQRLGITAVVCDLRHSTLPARSFDLIISNHTFEHIEPGVLLEILWEFKRLAHPRAVMSHLIDMQDHYAQFDRSINAFNFLRYSSKAWRLYNNRIHFQSRSRISDYRRLHAVTGWRIAFEENVLGTVDALRRTPLAEEFSTYSEQDLLVCLSWMVSELAAEGRGE